MCGPHLNPTVEGLRYEYHVYGMCGAPSQDNVDIFIPSKCLSVTNDGSARRSKPEYMVETKKARLVANEYLNECKTGQRKFNNYDFAELREKANDEAREKVQVPLVVVDELDMLIQDKHDLETKKEELTRAISDIDKKIADLTKNLF